AASSSLYHLGAGDRSVPCALRASIRNTTGDGTDAPPRARVALTMMPRKEVPATKGIVSRPLARPATAPYNPGWRRSFFSQGDRSMARTSLAAWLLLGLYLSRPALAVEPTSIPRATTQQVHQAVGRAIGYLQAESGAWLKTRKCAACHHAPMPLW